MDDELLIAAQHAAATLGAIYQWADHVEASGGASCISGVAACSAMLASLKNNRTRVEELIMEPLREAIKKAEK